MKNIKKLSFVAITAVVLVGGFVSSVPKVLAVAGEGTATIAVDGGAQGAGVTVVQSTSHIFTTVLTVGTPGMTLGASSPTFTIPTGFTAPHANGGAAVPANAGQVDVDGEWFAVAAGGGCTVAMGSSGASGQVITIDVTADCAAGHTITLTYKGTSSIAMGATALEVRTADGAPAAALIAAPPTITVTDATATLNVIKHVINDNSGTASAGDWILAVTSSNGGTGNGSTAGAELPGTAYTLQAGKAYSVAESGGPAGYSESDSADCMIVSAVSGATYTCTITNNDIAQAVSDEDEDEDEDEDNDVDIEITKKANPSTLPSGPGSVTYTYKVTNEGDEPLINVSVKDDKCSPVEYISGDTNRNDKLGVDEEWKYTCTKTVSQTETNKATARGSANGEEVRDTDTARVVVSVPGFPNAGIGPDENSSPRNISVLTGFSAIILSLYLVRKRLAI